jgi:hypothetical protein
MINRAIEVFDPAVQQANTPQAASATNRGYWGKRNRAAEPTINAAPLAKDGNGAVGPSNPAASTNTAVPPPSNRYYGYSGWYGLGYPYPVMYGSYGKRSNSNGGHNFNSAADDVPTINAAPIAKDGNGAVGPSNPAASTNTAVPQASNRYYDYYGLYGYGYGYPYGKRSNSNGGHEFNSAADDVPQSMLLQW